MASDSVRSLLTPISCSVGEQRHWLRYDDVTLYIQTPRPNLANDIAFDAERVWSSTPCTDVTDGVYTVAGNPSSSEADHPLSCQSKTAEVKCACCSRIQSLLLHTRVNPGAYFSTRCAAVVTLRSQWFQACHVELWLGLVKLPSVPNLRSLATIKTRLLTTVD